MAFEKREETLADKVANAIGEELIKTGTHTTAYVPYLAQAALHAVPQPGVEEVAKAIWKQNEGDPWNNNIMAEEWKDLSEWKKKHYLNQAAAVLNLTQGGK